MAPGVTLALSCSLQRRASSSATEYLLTLENHYRGSYCAFLLEQSEGCSHDCAGGDDIAELGPISSGGGYSSHGSWRGRASATSQRQSWRCHVKPATLVLVSGRSKTPVSPASDITSALDLDLQQKQITSCCVMSSQGSEWLLRCLVSYPAFPSGPTQL